MSANPAVLRPEAALALGRPAAESPAHLDPVPPDKVPPEVIPDLDKLVIENGEPVDNIYAEKQERLLTEPLYCHWSAPGGKSFQVFANVGLFYADKTDPLAPDAMLATDIPTGGNLSLRENRSYFIWDRGKPPDVAIEFVSDKRGREEDFKFDQYARIGVPYYVIYDPLNKLSKAPLRAFVNHAGVFQPLANPWFSTLGLGLVLWEGTFEGHAERWLRWCDETGRVIPTGQEGKEAERARADSERQRADNERTRADDERRKRELLEARLRELGVNPDE